MVDIRQTPEYANYQKLLGWNVERINNINYFIRKFPILGSVLKLQRPEKIDFDTIIKLCRKYRIFQTIIEPKDSRQEEEIKNCGYMISKSPYLPSKTLELNLTIQMNRLIRNMKKDARYAIKRGSGLTIREYSTPNEIKKWHEAWKNSVNLSRYVPPADQLINLRKTFPDNSSIFLASHNIFSRIIGGALFTRTSHGVAYYWYGFTNSEGRSSLSQYSLLYQGILWAKKNGCKVFDFEGIYDPRFPNKSWLGFTHFKRSFGGTEVTYPGCYTKFRFPL